MEKIYNISCQIVFKDNEEITIDNINNFFQNKNNELLNENTKDIKIINEFSAVGGSSIINNNTSILNAGFVSKNCSIVRAINLKQIISSNKNINEEIVINLIKEYMTELNVKDFNINKLNVEEEDSMKTTVEIINKDNVSNNIKSAFYNDDEIGNINFNNVYFNIEYKKNNSENEIANNILKKKNIREGVIEECERINQIGDKNNEIQGVHYIKDKKMTDEEIEAIAYTLYKNKRIATNGYNIINITVVFTGDYEKDIKKLRSIISKAIKSLVIVNINLKTHDSFQSISEDIKKEMIEIFNSMKYKTTFIFDISENVNDDFILKIKSDIKVIEFKEQGLDKDTAIDLLNKMLDIVPEKTKERIIKYIIKEYDEGKKMDENDIKNYAENQIEILSNNKFKNVYTNVNDDNLKNSLENEMNKLYDNPTAKKDMIKLFEKRKSNYNCMFIANGGLMDREYINIASNYILNSLGKNNEILQFDFTDIQNNSSLISGKNERKEESIENKVRSAIGGILLITNVKDIKREDYEIFTKVYLKYSDKITLFVSLKKNEVKHFYKLSRRNELLFINKVIFEDLNENQLMSYVTNELKKKNIILSDDAKEIVMKDFNKITNIDDYGNYDFANDYIYELENSIEDNNMLDDMNSIEIKSNNVNIDLEKLVPDKIFLLSNDNNPMEELDRMIGLHEIKSEIKNYISRIKLDYIRNKNYPNKNAGLNMNIVFAGPPGVGKTKVAKLIAEILYKEGIIYNPICKEVCIGDLIGQYTGQTAPNIKNIFEEVRGGVLFIDEAYALNRDDEFSKQAIDTIVLEMEENRDETIVIFAGYKDKMEDFIKSNPGLKGRINKYIDFNTYSIDELMLIFDKMIADEGFSIENENIKNIVREYLLQKMSEEDFANGREVRKCIEEAVRNQSNRIASKYNLSNIDISTISDNEVFLKDLHTLCEEDFTNLSKNFYKERNPIGFV